MAPIALLCLGLCVGIATIILTIIMRRKIFLAYDRRKCVFITGTDSGFGRTLALALDSKGVKVYAGCYTDQGMESLKLLSTDNIKPIKVDVTDEKSLLAARMVIEKDLKDGHQTLWGLVNNAGIGVGMIFQLSTEKIYRAAMEVNFFGTIRTTETFVPLIKKSRGRIINMLSSVRRIPHAIEPYACSKVASGVYTDGLRRCMKDYDVHVSGIEPGFVESNMTSRATVRNQIDANWKNLPDEIKDEYTNNFIPAVYSYVDQYFGKQLLSSSSTAGKVNDAIIHGLFAKHPKSTYICGHDAILNQMLGMISPDFIMDFSIRFRQRSFLSVIRKSVLNKRNVKFHNM